MALGASRAGILWLAPGQVLSLGVTARHRRAAALAASRFVESFLWGIEPGDPATMGAAAGGCCWPCASRDMSLRGVRRESILWLRCAESRVDDYRRVVRRNATSRPAWSHACASTVAALPPALPIVT